MDYEIFQFRSTKQNHDETIDQFATRHRKLASTCEFTDVGKEVESCIIQNCTSKRLRRYALLETDITLEKMLCKGRAFEARNRQAAWIEGASTET